MIDSTIKAYATRQLGGVVLAVLVVLGLAGVAAVSDARTPQNPGLRGSASGDARGQPRPHIRGIAKVSDGDTIEVAGQRIRLEGIDAPEAGQQCLSRFGYVWPCGDKATAMLARLIDGQVVECADHGTDKYGRMLGVCHLGDMDVNAEMVRRGFAWAFVRYSQAYVQVEAEAKAARAGIWNGLAVPAWEYRAGRWANAEHEAPAGCAIKGNVTSSGRIYHMPWSPWYAKVRMDGDRGKRWFCSEAEAVAAGWRPAGFH